MTTEVEIFKKYKPTEDGWISNTKFRQAIHEAYEAGLDNGSAWITRGADLQKAKNDIAQAIFAEIDKYKGYENSISGIDTLSYKTDGVVISLHDYQLLKLKCLKAKP